MVKILKGNFGECRICDNMDRQYGLPSLQDKGWDLCLTDFPFNVKYNGQDGKKAINQVMYSDSRSNEEYIDFLKKEFFMLKRITHGQIIFCGNMNVKYWYQIETPLDFGFHYKKNSHSRGSQFKLVKHDIFLIYGKLNHPIIESVLDIYLLNGFLREEDWIHPCPNNPDLYSPLVVQSRSNSVLDPFLGSGTTAEVCEELGIPWLGFELMEEYSPDIEKRIKRGISKHKQLKKQLTLI